MVEGEKKSYEFPDGFNLSLDSSSLAEILITGALTPTTEPASQQQHLGIADLIQRAVASCDVDLRGVLIGNVVLCGGTSLIPGVVDRLSLELSKYFSPVRRFFLFVFLSFSFYVLLFLAVYSFL